MILHVTFSDGSNPWISLPSDRHTIAKLWRQWMKNHPEAAKPEAICGSYRCKKSCWYCGYYLTSRNGEHLQRQYYKTLGHALQALERLGGETA